MQHFQSAAGPGQTNYFRVKVSGEAQTAKARYVSGFYDERALDLYFNEMKSSGTNDSGRLFKDTQTEPGGESFKPLTPAAGRGSLVMIFSTNPKAVTNTIGALAESRLNADALSNLLNKREVEAASLLNASKTTFDLSASALDAELDALLPAPSATTPPAAPASAPALQRQYLRALEAIARETGGPPALADFVAARAWLGRVK